MASHLADLKAKHLFKVRRLANEQKVEGPAPAEIGHDDGVDWHGGEELSPGGFEFLKGGGVGSDSHKTFSICGVLL